MHMSPLALGLWRITNAPSLRPQEVLSLLNTALDQGISTVDQADIYGDYGSEALFGQALTLDPALRERLQIVTKCGIKLISKNRPDHRIKYYDTGRQHIIASVENSLQQMQTDRIDLLLIHRPDPLMDADEVAAAFAELKSAGKVLHFGVSNFSPQQTALLQSRLDEPLITNQIEISPLHLDPFTDGSLDYMQTHRIRPMAWSPLGGGSLFSSESPAINNIKKAGQDLMEHYGLQGLDQLIYAWLMRHPAGIIPVLGTTKSSRIVDAARATQVQISRQDWFALYSAALGNEVP